MTALTAESLRRLAELGTRSPLYGPGVASVSKSEYARSIAASVDLIEQKDDWDVSSKGSTEVVIFDRPDPRSRPRQQQQQQQQQQQPIRRALTDFGDDSDDNEDKQRHIVTRQRRRASECVAPSSSILQKAAGRKKQKRTQHQHQEPKSNFLKNRLHQARAELLNKHDIQSLAGSSAEGSPSSSPGSGSGSGSGSGPTTTTTTTSRKRAMSMHYQPDKPAYNHGTGMGGTGGMPDWDAGVAALRSPSSLRPQSAYVAYQPPGGSSSKRSSSSSKRTSAGGGDEPIDRFGSPDIMELTTSGSLNGGGSVPATPIDPEAMWPVDCPPSVPPSPISSSIMERGRRISRLVAGRSRSNSRGSRPPSSHSFAPFVAATTAAISAALRSPTLALRSPTLTTTTTPSSPASSLHPSISTSSSSSSSNKTSSSSAASMRNRTSTTTTITTATATATSAATNNNNNTNSERGGRRPQRTPSSPRPKVPTTPDPNYNYDHGQDRGRTRNRSRSRSRSRSPGAGSYVENPTRRRSFIDRAFDKAEARVSQEVNKHLVRAGRRPLPSFRVRSISRSPVEDIASWRIGDGSPTSPPPGPAPGSYFIGAVVVPSSRGRARERGSGGEVRHRRAVSTGVGVGVGVENEMQERRGQGRGQGLRKNNKTLHRPLPPTPQNQGNITPYRAGFDCVENDDVSYRGPTEKESDELFGISVKRADSNAGLFEQPNNYVSATAQVLQFYHPNPQRHHKQPQRKPLRRESTPKLVIDTQLTYSPVALPAAIYDDDDSSSDVPEPLRRRRNRNDSLFLGSDISVRLAQDSFFPSTPSPRSHHPRPYSHPHSQPPPRSQAPQPRSSIPPPPRQQVRPRVVTQAYRPKPSAATAGLEALVQNNRIGDDDSILPDRPLDLGARPSSRADGGNDDGDADDREVLPSQASRRKSPEPALMRQRQQQRTLHRKAGNRSLR